MPTMKRAWFGGDSGRLSTCQFTHLYPVRQDRRFCVASPCLHPSNLFKYSNKCLHRVAMVELSRQRIMSKNNNVTTSFILVIFKGLKCGPTNNNDLSSRGYYTQCSHYMHDMHNYMSKDSEHQSLTFAVCSCCYSTFDQQGSSTWPQNGNIITHNNVL